MNYDNKSCLLTDLIDFWQKYKETKTHRRGLTKYRNLRGAALNWGGT